ncbi:MAG: bifunctional demethylmenaquinone methyltransferase/2-methoxy-6-polyprenyl-1,4-benzoquinol methylase UbiE [Bacteroidales bacterium]|nr:bifunctional demethylmenaquinone methyltransferase/2-methoxy-6-polyprenyl-1,4-benzoquinol methylase UbiE [Bacteroidales bacterium]
MITPYKNNKSGKKEQVAFMFNNIARRYDFLNHFLSLGIDKIWRKKAINSLKGIPPKPLILDIATGTGDLAVAALKYDPQKIIGIDISEKMLEVGREKIEKKNLSHTIDLQKGDSENILFEENYFDAATVAFGVRNFENLGKGLKEINRVLKSKGKLVVLEFSKPQVFPVKQLYDFYFKRMLPFIGKIISKDYAAYTYLYNSVNAFPEGDNFISELKKAGFENCKAHRLSFGIATIYSASK